MRHKMLCVHSPLSKAHTPVWPFRLYGAENERGVLYETKIYFYPVSIVVYAWIECMGIGAE